MNHIPVTINPHDTSFFLQQLNSIMQDCLKRFARRKLAQKWTEEEKDQLREIVNIIQPEKNQDWRQICVKMQQLGSRRTIKEYKNQGIYFLTNCQKQQIKLNESVFNRILSEFEDGTSVTALTKKHASSVSNPVRVRSRLVARFQSIRRSIRRIVGLSKLRDIKVQDCQLFAFVRSNNLNLLTLTEVGDLCDRYSDIRKAKTELEKEELKIIQEKLENFNSSLWKYSDMFDEFKKNQPKETKDEGKSDSELRSHCDKSTIAPIRHLAEVVKSFQISSPKTPSSEESSEKFLSELNELKLSNHMTICTANSLTLDDQEWRFDSFAPKVFTFCSIDQELQEDGFYGFDQQSNFYLNTGI